MTFPLTDLGWSRLPRRWRWLCGCVAPFLLMVLTRHAPAWLDWLLMVGIGLGLLLVYRRFLAPLLRYLHDHLVQASLLGLTIALVYGVGDDFEIPDVIWGVSLGTRLLSGILVTVVLAILGINAFHLDDRRDETEPRISGFLNEWGIAVEPGGFLEPRRPSTVSLSAFLRAARLPFLILVTLPAVFRGAFPGIHRLEETSDPSRDLHSQIHWSELLELAAWMLGLFLGTIAVKFFLVLADLIGGYVEQIVGAASGVRRDVKTHLVAMIHDFNAWARYWFNLLCGVFDPTIRPSFVGPPYIVASQGNGGAPVVGETSRRQALLSLTCVFTTAYALIAWFGADWVSPGFALFALVGVTVALDGLIRVLVSPKGRIGFLFLLLFWIGFANQPVFKLRFENLAYDERTRVEIARHDPRLEETFYPRRKFLPSLSATNAPDARNLTPTMDGRRLVSNQESLNAWAKRNAKPGGAKPKLVVIACSGGGIRAAHWTANVLTWLEEELDEQGFRDSIRLISASSAGSVGAAHYVKRLYDQNPATLTPARLRLRPDRHWLVDLPENSLGMLASSIALRDMPRTLVASDDGTIRNDRGKVLESTWKHLREISFSELRELERSAKLPSLVMAPMLTEDGRRLFIGNLDMAKPARELVLYDEAPILRNLSIQRAHALFLEPRLAEGITPENKRLTLHLKEGLDLFPPKVQDEAVGNLEALEEANPILSVSGFEFFKLFSRDQGFRLSTAARMTATFPVISPLVYLPTIPAMRPVDSGFRDNFGVELAADWIFQNREWLEQNTSGVALIQIRCINDEEQRRGVVDNSGNWASRGFQFLTSVPEAAFNAFHSGASFRNDRELSELGSLLNPPGKPPFFTTVVFELPCFARRMPITPRWPRVPDESDVELWEMSSSSISWSLTSSEARALREHALPRSRLAPQPDERRRILIELGNSLKAETDPRRKLALRWEYGRARNHERMVALRTWWK